MKGSRPIERRGFAFGVAVGAFHRAVAGPASRCTSSCPYPAGRPPDRRITASFSLQAPRPSQMTKRCSGWWINQARVSYPQVLLIITEVEL